jgi:hypothetical protein
VLHSISPSIIDHDIYIFVEYNLNVIRQERSLNDGWPGEQVIKRLVQKACGLFIWAATACRFVSEGRQFTERRLSLILQSGVSLTAPDRHLNEIYITILNNSVGHGYDDYEREELLEKLRNVLGSIVVLFSPLSAGSLCRLVYLTEQSVDQALEDLHAILDIPKNKARPLRLHHPSFRDFLLDKGRCGGSNFWVNEKRAHQTLAESCIRLMSTFLKQDICEQDVPGALVADVESSRVEQCVPPEVQYACLYWVEHLQKSGAQLCDNNRVHQFLQTHSLHWLEALSWMRKMSEGILAISSLESIALVSLVQHVTNMQLTYRADVRLSPAIRFYSRHKAIRALRPGSDRAGSSASILQRAYFCTGEEHSKEAVRRQDTRMDAKVIQAPRRLERIAADA